jgi:tetratricopeptide (TPR) repeat protein
MLESASDRAKAQFALLIGEAHREQSGNANGNRNEPFEIPFDAMTKREWTRDDANALSLSFDSALSRGAVDEIERLAHMWLISEPPQVIELGAGRRVSDDLVSTVERRVIQLRRADDYITGETSHDLMRSELTATVKLLSDASLTEEQARRLLVSVGEMAQLGAWVAADTGELDQAARYVRGGVMAARAGRDYALAGNIISTFSYQVANNGNPNDAAVLAQTAYQGGREDATPVTRALLLERVAWAAARSGDLRNCERTLGQVEDSFAAGPRDNDPDWVYWLNREEIDVMAGRCYTELGRPAQAEQLLTAAIGRYDQTLIRENSLYLSWLAEDYVQLEEVEHAADLATRMAILAGRTNSARADTRLRFLAGRLEPFKANPRVAEFFDAYRAVTVPEPRRPE